MLEYLATFFAGMVVGLVGFILVVAVMIGSDSRHWRK